MTCITGAVFYGLNVPVREKYCGLLSRRLTLRGGHESTTSGRIGGFIVRLNSAFLNKRSSSTFFFAFARSLASLLDGCSHVSIRWRPLVRSLCSSSVGTDSLN